MKQNRTTCPECGELAFALSFRCQWPDGSTRTVPVGYRFCANCGPVDDVQRHVAYKKAMAFDDPFEADV